MSEFAKNECEIERYVREYTEICTDIFNSLLNISTEKKEYLL